MALGTDAPDFTLSEVVSGKEASLKDFKDKKVLLVMFICAHCPYVKHVEEELARIGADYADKDTGIAAISSNDPDYAYEDKPEGLKKQSERLEFNFAYLFDESQEVARSYAAACTPDFFLFDKDRKLVYRGQLDDSRPENDKPVTGKDLRYAIDAILSDKDVPTNQKPSAGCNIKWKSGNEPEDY